MYYSRYHTATFNGKHNLSKSKLLLILYYAQTWAKHSLTVSELQGYTGLSRYSVCSLCWRLNKWDYIYRRPTRIGYEYHIAARGKRFIEHIPKPLFDELIPYLQNCVNNYNITKNSPKKHGKRT